MRRALGARSVEADVRREVEAAVAFAEESPQPDPAEAFEDVYA
jgi:TPP-dependent pyruvate/acetoin dehydrogenase alpha subunit